MSLEAQWRKEAGARVRGSRPLDQSKVQAPGVVRLPAGGYRLFYTAVGPGKPFPKCQGYILSAISEDGVVFRPEDGIRVAPDPALLHMSLRVLAPTVARTRDGRWRMYFEARGAPGRPTVIGSAVSSDLLAWKIEAGIRLQGPASLSAPRYLELADGRGRVHCITAGYGPTGERISHGVTSGITADGLNFEFEPGYRLQAADTPWEKAGITAAEVVPPTTPGGDWSMFYSAWEGVPAGTVLPLHPSNDPDALTNGQSENFAQASIASDMAGYRSRIFRAISPDGLRWTRDRCVLEGLGYGRDGLDAVHAEDMSLVAIGGGRYRMYYAACDRMGEWLIASAVTGD